MELLTHPQHVQKDTEQRIVDWVMGMVKETEDPEGAAQLYAVGDGILSGKYRMSQPASPPPDGPCRTPPQEECTHGVHFDEVAYRGLGPNEVRRRWPRMFGDCPLGCGFHGIAYASYLHYLAGDW